MIKFYGKFVKDAKKYSKWSFGPPFKREKQLPNRLKLIPKR